VSNIFFQTDSLTLGYGNEIVINKLKLSLDKTKNYEIIGKNGAGKTTLLNFISNNFDGNSFNSKYTKEELDILEISHTPTLLPNLTLSENAIYFTSSKNIDAEIIESAIEKYDLGSYKTDELKNFSSGMIKRAELAIAEMKEPHILCIDEPLNYLDKQGINHLQTLINERAQNSKSNILSSQETSGLLKNKETINLDEIK
jgi:ABC-type multidrug transport system ATPase subunit